ncbi:MAG: DMT family transporter [Alphaproteobacteria bacterium]
MPFFVMGLLNNVIPFGFLFAAQTLISVGLTSIVNAMTPLFTIVVMVALGVDRLTGSRIAGVVLGVGGVAVLRGVGGARDDRVLLGLVGTLSCGFAVLWTRRRLQGVPPLRSATCQLLSSIVLISPVVALFDQPWTFGMPSNQPGSVHRRSGDLRDGNHLYCLLQDYRARRGQQRDTGDPVDSGQRYLARDHVVG